MRQVEEAEQARPPLPTEIAGYTILGGLGIGGMGVVFRAKQPGTKQIVALKVLRRERMSTRRRLLFKYEAEVLGRLQHPGIARILEAGTARTSDGWQSFFAMELIDGPPLTRYAENNRLNHRDRLELILKVCEAVHHAHQKGVIHRDLKPANILVDQSGQPKVLDFGIARSGEAARETTRPETACGRRMGTLQYMSPEQIEGDWDKADTRSDIFTLGVVTYELLAGRHPFVAHEQSDYELERAICEQQASRLSLIDRSLHGDLEAIVTRSLEKDKGQRYQSVSDLAADIRCYLNCEPVAAHPATRRYQLAKFVKRNRTVLAPTVAIFLALFFGLMGTIWKAGEARQEARMADAMLGVFSRAVSIPNWFLRPPENRKLLDTLAGRIERASHDSPELEALLRDRFGFTYFIIADYDEAESHLRRALEIGLNENDAVTQQVLRSFDVLGNVLRDSGKLEDFEENVRSGLDASGYPQGNVIQLAETNDGFTYALRVLRLRYSLAQALHHRGRLVEAEEIYRDTLDNLRIILERRHTDPHRDVSDVKNALGRRNFSPDEHQDVNDVQSNLGLLLVHRGKNLDEAVQLLEEVLEYRRLHDVDSKRGMTVVNLGLALLAQGKIEVAEKHFVAARKFIAGELGPDHPATIRSLNALARVTQAQGRLNDAATLFRQAVGIAQRDLPEHWRTAVYHGDYGMCLTKLGRHVEAEVQLEAAYEQCSVQFGDEDYRTQRLISALMDLYEAWRKPGDVDEWRELLIRTNGDDLPTSPGPWGSGHDG